MHFILGQPITVESIGLTLENLPIKADDHNVRWNFV